MRNRQKEMEKQNRDSEARMMQQKMQEQAILQEAMKEQEKALKNHLATLNKRQVEEFQEKMRLIKMNDQAKGLEMA